MKNYRQAMEAAPPTPACFSSRESWAAYLLTAQQCSKQQPFTGGGIYRPEWSFCADCTLLHSTLMSRSGKCNPSQFRVIRIVKKERTHECPQ